LYAVNKKIRTDHQRGPIDHRICEELGVTQADVIEAGLLENPVF